MKINKGLREGCEPVERERAPSVLWDALSTLMQIGVLGAGVVLLFRYFGPMEERIRDERREVTVAERRLAERTALRDDQKERIHLLKNDPGAVERAARDELNLGREGELIFRFDPPRTSKPAPAN